MLIIFQLLKFMFIHSIVYDNNTIQCLSLRRLLIINKIIMNTYTSAHICWLDRCNSVASLKIIVNNFFLYIALRLPEEQPSPKLRGGGLDSLITLGKHFSMNIQLLTPFQQPLTIQCWTQNSPSISSLLYHKKLRILLIFILSAERRPLQDIGLPKAPMAARDLHQVVGPQCIGPTHASSLLVATPYTS